jgi:hypothetical protein
MTWNRTGCRWIAVVGGAALIAVGALVAGCTNDQRPAPTTTTSTTTTTTPPVTSAAPPTPTEKSLNPTAGNLFTPQVIAPAAPTEPPGVHRHRGG